MRAQSDPLFVRVRLCVCCSVVPTRHFSQLILGLLRFSPVFRITVSATMGKKRCFPSVPSASVKEVIIAGIPRTAVVEHEEIGLDEDLQTFLSPQLQLLASRTLNEDEAAVRRGLVLLRSWIHANRHAVRCRQDSNFLLRFLRMKKHKPSDALAVLQKYLRMRQSEPQYFCHLDICDPAIDDLVSRGYMFVLPDRDSAGRRVIVSRGSRVDPSRHTQEQVIRVNMMTFETLLQDEENQVRGFTYLFDQKGVGFSHIFMWSPSLATHMISCSESAMPMRHQQMNFFNMGMLVQTVLEFVKNMLSKKLQSRFFIYSSMESLHQTLPVKILPKEYGGDQDITLMIESWKAELRASRASLLNLDKMGFLEQGDDAPSLISLEQLSISSERDKDVLLSMSPSLDAVETL